MRDERDVRVIGGSFETRGHAARSLSSGVDARARFE